MWKVKLTVILCYQVRTEYKRFVSRTSCFPKCCRIKWGADPTFLSAVQSNQVGHSVSDKSFSVNNRGAPIIGIGRLSAVLPIVGIGR
jgi:hypothetical protein